MTATKIKTKKLYISKIDENNISNLVPGDTLLYAVDSNQTSVKKYMPVTYIRTSSDTTSTNPTKEKETVSKKDLEKIIFDVVDANGFNRLKPSRFFMINKKTTKAVREKANKIEVGISTGFTGKEGPYRVQGYNLETIVSSNAPSKAVLRFGCREFDFDDFFKFTTRIKEILENRDTYISRLVSLDNLREYYRRYDTTSSVPTISVLRGVDTSKTYLLFGRIRLANDYVWILGIGDLVETSKLPKVHPNSTGTDILAFHPKDTEFYFQPAEYNIVEVPTALVDTFKARFNATLVSSSHVFVQAELSQHVYYAHTVGVNPASRTIGIDSYEINARELFSILDVRTSEFKEWYQSTVSSPEKLIYEEI